MILLNLYAEIQANPNSFNAYRQLIKYYEDNNMINESKAFQLLLEEKIKNDNIRSDS